MPRSRAPRRVAPSSLVTFALGATCVAAIVSVSCSESTSYTLCGDDCAEGGAAGTSSNAATGAGGTAGDAATASGGSDTLSGNGGMGAAAGGPSIPEGGASGADAGGGSSGDQETGESGATGIGGDTNAPDPCDAAASPADEPCLISDAHAVFVRANEGTSAGEGTMGSPLGSLERALELAVSERKIVIACSSHNFFQPLVIADPVPGFAIRIFGGFNCTTDGGWAPSETPTAVTPASGPALRIQGMAGVEIADFRFIARDATEPGESSIAGVVASSESVVFRRVRFEAGEGVRGDPGAPPQAELAPAPNGNSATALSGGPAQMGCTCSQSVGGRGGDLGTSNTRDGEPGLPTIGESGKGGPGGASSCTSGSTGGIGAAPSPGAGATLPGTLAGLEWTPSSGQPGQSGPTAQGGGGGGGGATGGGGSGGCGGCGGAGGSPGQSGGSSIGLLMIDSDVAFYESHVTTSTAGDGGDGAPGQRGQNPGLGGAGVGSGCDGGTGGNGRDGAPGGSGAGGLSVGVVYRGPAPQNLEELEDTLGQPGAGGEGTTVTAGLAGVRAKALGL